MINSNNNNINFGTRLIIAKSSENTEKIIRTMPDKALNEIIEAGKLLANNGVDDTLVLSIKGPDAYSASAFMTIGGSEDSPFNKKACLFDRFKESPKAQLIGAYESLTHKAMSFKDCLADKVMELFPE